MRTNTFIAHQMPGIVVHLLTILAFETLLATSNGLRLYFPGVPLKLRRRLLRFAYCALDDTKFWPAFEATILIRASACEEYLCASFVLSAFFAHELVE